MRRALVSPSRRPLSTPLSRTCLSLVPYRMAGNSIKSRGHVTDLAKLNIIGPTQARDNERHRVEVSRSFVCKCIDVVIICVDLNLFMTERSGYSDGYAPSQACYADLSGDALSVPTRDMYEYAAQASLGDDVYHEPHTAALEAHMARLFGKEAAVFVPSGTMANQLAVRSHLKQPPYSILCDHRAHIYECEAGGLALHSGAQVIPVIPSNGREPFLCRWHEDQLTLIQKDVTLPSKTFPNSSS